MDGKKQPEVPPKATPAPEARTASAPRQRARTRMRDMLLAGTAASIGLSTTFCSVAVDPMPPPEWNCSDSASALWHRNLDATAAWHLIDREWAITVNMTLGSWFVASSPLKFSGNPIVTGAVLKTAAVDSSTVEFTCVPAAGSEKISAVQPLACESNAIAVKFELDISSTKTEGAAVAVRPVQ